MSWKFWSKFHSQDYCLQDFSILGNVDHLDFFSQRLYHYLFDFLPQIDIFVLPRLVIMGNALMSILVSYVRYLEAKLFLSNILRFKYYQIIIQKIGSQNPDSC